MLYCFHCIYLNEWRRFYEIKLKDPGSAITHGIALLLAAVGAVPLIIKAARSYDVLHIVALSIFILTMVLLYAPVPFTIL